jgi:hypothetical protein
MHSMKIIVRHSYHKKKGRGGEMWGYANLLDCNNHITPYTQTCCTLQIIVNMTIFA